MFWQNVQKKFRREHDVEHKKKIHQAKYCQEEYLNVFKTLFCDFVFQVKSSLTYRKYVVLFYFK